MKPPELADMHLAGSEGGFVWLSNAHYCCDDDALIYIVDINGNLENTHTHTHTHTLH